MTEHTHRWFEKDDATTACSCGEVRLKDDPMFNWALVPEDKISEAFANRIAELDAS